MFWEEENSVSVHNEHEVRLALPPAIGNDCTATFKGRDYTGKIAATGNFVIGSVNSITMYAYLFFTGTKREMVAKMNDFYKGSFTLFEGIKVLGYGWIQIARYIYFTCIHRDGVCMHVAMYVRIQYRL